MESGTKERDVSGGTNETPADVGCLVPPCFTGTKIYKEALDEMDRIRAAHRTLAPTGCTPTFCQSGRMTSINEPRVGRDRPIAEIQQEAVDFLKECRDHGVITADEELDERIKEALTEISNTAIVSTVTYHDGKTSEGLAGGTYHQRTNELEYGVRAAWRNSRRCIMRSEHEHLALCDLRAVQSSREMARSTIKGMQKAFNRGHILPTVFMFPPRAPRKRGPMIWNSQILAFAGYKQEDGSILGDPANVELTKSMIEFGWKPPMERSRWDFLPLITMAEDDSPYMMELPLKLRRTVQITHPLYAKEFSDLDLKWVVAPALSRLGFDIGGNQYTASPFIGWFVAFQDLPEYMQLVALSRAQAELNFAVYYSYLHDHVMMIDSMTSSVKYKNFDSDRKDEVGYRLPAAPYWPPPPQGSIIPIWHDGGSPNYQPKPMICRHVQNPINAWRRETPESERTSQTGIMKMSPQTKESRPRIKIFSCTAGVNAGKMARKLYEVMQRLVHKSDDPFEVDKEKTLNQLNLSGVRPEDVILIIASTTGRGEIPRNAQRFVKRYTSTEPLSSAPRFSCFANGDSTYGDTYNAAGKAIQQIMTSLGCRSLLSHCFAGDAAVRNPDWNSFTQWVENLDHLILGNQHKIELPRSLSAIELPTTSMSDLPTATLVRIHQPSPGGLAQITLDIGDRKYHEMDHVKILAPNPDCEVDRALAALKLSSTDKLDWHDQTAGAFLSRYVDLHYGFKTLDWYPDFEQLSKEKQTQLKDTNALAVLESVELQYHDSAIVESILKDMASIVPRLYSVASCPDFPGTETTEQRSGNLVDIVVKINPGGRFSDIFLTQANIGAQLRFGLTSPDTWGLIQSQKPNAPLIAICTGSGIGPVRALLQRRIVDLGRTTGDITGRGSESREGAEPTIHQANSGVSSTLGSVSLFAGFKKDDSNFVERIIDPASHAGILDLVELCPSNPDQTRIQDHILMEHVKEKLIEKLRDPACIVFVCANELAAEGAMKSLTLIAGTDIKGLLQERFIEEVFRA